MAINNFIGEYQIKDTSICDKLITYFKNNISRASKGGSMINGELEVDETNKESVDLGIDNLNDIDYYFKSFNQDCLDKYKNKYEFSNRTGRYAIKEVPNIQYYKPGGGYKNWHCERLDSDYPFNNRHLVFMTYLNTIENAGTEFFHQDLKVDAVKGKTLIWPADWTHTHRGIINNEKEKYIFTGWLSFY